MKKLNKINNSKGQVAILVLLVSAIMCLNTLAGIYGF